MQCDVTRCIICISDKVETLDRERCYKNSTRIATLWKPWDAYFSEFLANMNQWTFLAILKLKIDFLLQSDDKGILFHLFVM